MAARLVLGLSALVWLPYGLYCFAQPGALAEAAGVAAAHASGTVELQAMYGGLQAGVGPLCALGAARSARTGPALRALLFLTGGLGLARLVGVAGAGTLDGYHAFALGLEGLSAGLAAWLLARGAAPQPA